MMTLELTRDELIPLKIAVDKGIEVTEKSFDDWTKRSKESNPDGSPLYEQAARNAEITGKWLAVLKGIKNKIYRTMGVTPNEEN